MSNSRIYINTNTQCSEQQKQIILECRRLAFLKDAIEDFILYLTNKNNITKHLNQKTNIECIKYQTIEQLAAAINNGEIQSFILNENEYQLLEKYTDLTSKTRIIYTNKIIDTI